MKTLKDLFEVLAEATNENGNTSNHWFINFSGHVNKISVKHYDTGWKTNGEGHSQDCEQTLNEEGIQAVYWFVKTRLRKERSGKELFEALADGTTYAPLK